MDITAQFFAVGDVEVAFETDVVAFPNVVVLDWNACWMADGCGCAAGLKRSAHPAPSIETNERIRRNVFIIRLTGRTGRQDGRDDGVMPCPSCRPVRPVVLNYLMRSATRSRATMLRIFIIGLIAGPAVSLYGSPTVSPVTAAWCAKLFLPPKWPDSMYFFALSHAPPPFVMEMATKRPVTMDPIRSPPNATGPSQKPTTTGAKTGRSAGTIICLIAALVTMSTVFP